MAKKAAVTPSAPATLSITSKGGQTADLVMEEFFQLIRADLLSQGPGSQCAIMGPDDVRVVQECFVDIQKALDNLDNITAQFGAPNSGKIAFPSRNVEDSKLAGTDKDGLPLQAAPVVDPKNLITVVGLSEKSIDKLREYLNECPVKVDFISLDDYKLKNRGDMGRLIVWCLLGGHNTKKFPEAIFFQQQKGVQNLSKLILKEAREITDINNLKQAFVQSTLAGVAMNFSTTWLTKLIAQSLQGIARRISSIGVGISSIADSSRSLISRDQKASHGGNNRVPETRRKPEKSREVLLAGFTDELRGQIEAAFNGRGVNLRFISANQAKQLPVHTRNVVVLPVGAGIAAQKLKNAQKIPLLTPKKEVLAETIKLIEAIAELTGGSGKKPK